LSHLKPDDYREFRNLVIEMVLSTDMSTHFTQLKTVRSMLKETRCVRLGLINQSQCSEQRPIIYSLAIQSSISNHVNKRELLPFLEQRRCEMAQNRFTFKCLSSLLTTTKLPQLFSKIKSIALNLRWNLVDAFTLGAREDSCH